MTADGQGRAAAGKAPPDSAAALAARQRRRRFGIAMRITAGLSVMMLLVVTIAGVSLSSFRTFRAEVTSLSRTTLPELITGAELHSSLQKLVAQLPLLASATSTPQRRSIYNEVVSDLETLHLLVARMRGQLNEDAALERGAASRPDALHPADLAAHGFGPQCRGRPPDRERRTAQSEAARGLSRLSDGLERLSDPDAGPWCGAHRRPDGAGRRLHQLEHLSRLKAEQRAAERTLGELGRSPSRPPAVGSHYGGHAPGADRPAGIARRPVPQRGGAGAGAQPAQALTGQARVLAETVDRSTRTLFEALRDQSADRTDAIVGLITERGRVVLALVGASALLAVGVYFVFRRFLSSRLVGLNDAVMQRVAGTQAAIPVGGHDEITDIASSIRYFIDEIDRRQRDLAENERRFRSLVEGSIQGIIIHRNFRPLYANDSFAAMLNMTVPEVLALPSLGALVTEDELPQLVSNAEYLISTGQPTARRRIRARRLDGSLLWVELTGRRVEWMDGPAVQAVVVDVTREVEAEEALRQSRDAAEQALRELKATQASLIQAEKMASLGQLVAGVAHEVNTPIGITITGASQLQALMEELERQHAAGALRRSDFQRFLTDGQEMANLILANCTRAANLVQSFKLVAVDQSSDERRSFLLREYVEELLRSLHPTYKNRQGLQIVIDCPEEIELDGYPGALSQILTNLIMNALIHALEPEEPGTITIAARLTDRKTVELIVADTGRGIAPEVLPKIFDPFFTTRRGSGGSGLGLHIVYNLVTSRLHGTISVDSGLGRGTRFTLRFPRIADPAVAAA
ncbi:PAS domain-containing sensor histidine kinase [Azospirillum thermophilum]|uniref:sensor histidine kinase n=1 Tax=Azospirillum thermophilum TaxID=2202148 RepID=UPI001FE9A30A|nr:PAS domain-containing sensor histidine kinase [Azospirillum thermophilum]